MQNVLAFAGAALLLALVPGPSTAVVLRQTLRSGRRAGLAATLANELGALIWVLIAAFGLTTLVAASQTAYDVLRLVGALVLVILGAQSLWHARRRGPTPVHVADPVDSVGPVASPPVPAPPQAQAVPHSASRQHGQHGHEQAHTHEPEFGHEAVQRRGPEPGETWRAFRIGLVTTVANPKAAVFAAAFLPQFVPPHAPVLATLLLLAGVWVLVDVSWYVVLVALVSQVRDLFARAAVRRRLEQITGLALMGFGARLAFTNR